MLHKCFIGGAAGFAAHQVRPVLARYMPERPGWFPLSCYLVGGLVLIGVSWLLFGRRQAGRVLMVLGLVGSGVGLGWWLDG